MAVYNISYAGLKQVQRFTQDLLLSVRKIFFSNDKINIVKLKLRSHLEESEGEEVGEGEEEAKKKTEYHDAYVTIRKGKQSLNDYESDKYGQRFISLYCYFGTYCFLVLLMSGIIAGQPKPVANQLFYYLDVYNSFLIVPYILLFLREKIETPPTAFLLIFLLHLGVTLLYINLNYADYTILKISGIIRLANYLWHDHRMVLFFLACLILVFVLTVGVEAFRIIRKIQKDSERELFTSFVGTCIKIVVGVIALIMYSFVVRIIIGPSNIDSPHTIIASIIITFSPMIIVISRTLVGFVIIRKGMLEAQKTIERIEKVESLKEVFTEDSIKKINKE